MANTVALEVMADANSGLADVEHIAVFAAAEYRFFSKAIERRRGKALSGNGAAGRSGSTECSDRTESASGGAHYEEGIMRADRFAAECR